MRRREALRAIGGATAWTWFGPITFACQSAGSGGTEPGTREAPKDGEIIPAPDAVRRLELPKDTTSVVAMSADGARVVAGTWDGALMAWEVTTRRLLYEKIPAHEYPIGGITISSDGSRIATGGPTRFLKINRGFGFTGRYLGSVIKIWNGDTGKLLDEFEPAKPAASFSYNFTLSPDNRRLLSVGVRDGELTIRDIEQQRDIAWRGREGTPGAADLKAAEVAFSRDGRWVAGFREGSQQKKFYPPLKLWDLVDRRIDALDLSHIGSFYGPCALSPEGRLLAVKYLDHHGSYETRRHLALLDLKTGALARQFAFKPEMSSYFHLMAFSPDGTRVVSSSETGISQDSKIELRLWDVATGRQLQAYAGPPGKVRAVAFLPGSRLRVVSGGARVLADENGLMTGVDPIKLWEVDLPKPP